MSSEEKLKAIKSRIHYIELLEAQAKSNLALERALVKVIWGLSFIILCLVITTIFLLT
jgi:hypothetical protein